MAEETKEIKIYEDLFYKIKEYHGIEDIWIKTLQLLESYGFSDHALAVICIYFSLLDDGNTCISLDPCKLRKKWGEKWKGLVISSGKEDTLDPLSEDNLTEGINELIKLNDEKKLNGLFVIDDGWLFAKKYYDARKPIADTINAIFSKNRSINLNIEKIYFPSEELSIDYRQKEAIEEGLKRNLIITGGPGTGKTTVIYYVLKNILISLEGKGLDYDIYLAAPSGKAADRLGESIRSSLKKDNDFNGSPAAYKKLSEAKASTIHRLLSYSPKDNGFKYNADHKFREESIFVIDEASMIDICLFRNLLEAIDEKSIVFIMGDSDQLPSVDAGAVLGNILEKKKGIINLEKSHRCDPKIWNAARERINHGLMPDWDDSNEKTGLSRIDKDESDSIIKEWFESSAGVEPIDFDVVDREKRLNDIYSNIRKQKILCAERRGPRGVETLNRQIRTIAIRQSSLKNKENPDLIDHFAGEQLIITRNLPLLDLYNGDNGIVVKIKGKEDFLYFMIEKGGGNISEDKIPDETEMNHVFYFKGYGFFPLHLIPSDSIELAYAITIHKSQGSGYNKVLIYLPEKEGHPLLNRQILYTAITRAESHAYIVADETVLEWAISNKVERDTNINLINTMQ